MYAAEGDKYIQHLLGKSENKTSLARSRRRCEDNIKL
jgi:hypothetical protein